MLASNDGAEATVKSVSPSTRLSRKICVSHRRSPARRISALMIALQPVEQLQPAGGHLLHRATGFSKQMIRDEVVRLSRKCRLQSSAPRKAQFCADVDDRHASRDRTPKVIVVGCRPAMQGQRQAGCRLDLRNPADVEMLSRLAAHHG